MMNLLITWRAALCIRCVTCKIGRWEEIEIAKCSGEIVTGKREIQKALALDTDKQGPKMIQVLP